MTAVRALVSSVSDSERSPPAALAALTLLEAAQRGEYLLALVTPAALHSTAGCAGEGRITKICKRGSYRAKAVLMKGSADVE